ncbi:YlmC/YmxH family sporulation protein [Peribacillus frigoritolerans]|uniref:YlmC/YmxH family sporulation protein n=1 Tax=Peribacillus TaxID=2675229 RepID=UPI001F4E62BC|nr:MULTISPECIES: YlmC/YmxH family sporulation protein [Peribacillus]MCK1983871.1 YlmC/YmxH family sporulation protein [Peribacillus sp. Aquil_B1]MCK2008947.1 YlmC/YmxH family sporulation protein [Peribacillus sp. Aquil_B8]MED3996388.1 YlmC/YmxH family sporulation protein [Peribacillus frigoritolerans]MED4632367.1 YlmC/YmxH family sporulation protein [Peribacillus frigoritolerans]MED4695995.1 YlmC/YmxH family sporulation protein [Peribacillus frigoritolerans]
MRLSELSGKEIVDVNRAERLGVLGQTDLEIDETGQITSLIIPSVKWFGLLRNGSEIRVPWEHIKKIGADMVIIDFQEGLSLKDGEHMDG